MTALAPRLAYAAGHRTCSRRGHETHVITDGLTAYAAGTGTGATDAEDPRRTGTVITLTCTQPDAEGEPCGGEVSLDLAYGGVWSGVTTPAEQAVEALLTRYGRKVER